MRYLPVSMESPVGGGFARTRDIIVVAALLATAAAGLVVVMVQAWPPPVPPSDRPDRVPDVVVRLFGGTFRFSRETSLFVVVVCAGAVGGTVHAMRSLFWYVGNRALRRSWLMMYLFLPFTGGLLALVVYLVLRGGLTSPAGGSTDVNPYGMAAIAALVGLFSRETAEKLRAVFATLLSPAQAGRDQALPPQVRAVEPASAPVGAAVVVRGSGLGSATAVRFGAVDAPAGEVTDTSLRVTVPEGAASGRLTVLTPAGSATSPADFTVE